MMKDEIVQMYSGEWDRFYRRHIPDIRETGKEVNGNCPLCQEQKRHFYANIANGLFDCKKCGASGDAFDFYAQMHRLDVQTAFPEVLQLMSEDASVVKNTEPRGAKKKAPKVKLSDTSPITAETVAWFKKQGRSFLIETWQHFGAVQAKYPRNRPCIAFQQPNGGYHIWLMKVGKDEKRWRFTNGGHADLLGEIEGETVYLVEGEFDAMAAWDAGLRSVITNTAGARTVEPIKAGSERFRDLAVSIAYDNDLAGAEGQEEAARALQGIAKSVHVVRWPPGLKKGYDLRDFLTEGHQIGDLVFREWTPPEPEMVEGVALVEEEKRRVFISNLLDDGGSLLECEIPPIQWVVEDMLPRFSCMLLTGRSKLGKSWFSLQLARSVCTGRDFLGHKTKQGTVLYLGLEDGKRRLQRRLRDQGWEVSEARRAFFGYELKGGLNLDGLDLLGAMIGEIEPALVVIDSLSKARPAGMRENRAEDMTQLLDSVLRLAQDTGSGILVVHHLRKGSGFEGVPGEDIRGSSAILAAVDGFISLYRKGNEAETRMEILGRDMESSSSAIGFTGSGWTYIGGAEIVGQRDKQRAVIGALRELGEATAKDIAEKLKRPQQSVKRNLDSIVKDGFASAREDRTAGRPTTVYTWVG